jgi:dipeptidase E
MNLLLLSNSTNVGQPYLDWPLDYIDRFLGDVRNCLFIPYAAVNFSYDDYETKVQQALQVKGINVRSIHHADDPTKAIESAESILVGGGNSFHLLHTIQKLGLVESIRSKVLNDNTPYIGWSAGSNLACPTIKTTNDMPIIEPASFDALNLIHFQINPHFTEQTIAGHGGESRLMRLEEYSAINDIPVVCLPEGCGIRIDEKGTKLLSAEPIKLLTANGEVKTLQHGMIEV